MSAVSTAPLSLTDAAEALFVCDLAAAEDLPPSRVRHLVADAIVAHHGCACIAGEVAQEYGEHPDLFPGRMRRCLAAARTAFGDLPGGAA